MTDMYNKLFTKILDSSVWMESKDTRLVFLTFLAAMDEDGFVRMASVANVAHRARVEPEMAQVAVTILESPDPNSSDPDHEGRRIERIDGGWIVLNSQKYRALVTKAIIQEQTRERVKRFREKKRTGNASVTGEKRSVTPSEAVSKAEAVIPPLSPRATDERTETALLKANGPIPPSEASEIDSIDEELRSEESRFMKLCGEIREAGEEVQAVIDSLPRPATRSPFNASRMLRTGLSGVPRTSAGVTVLRLLCDALEARQRAQAAPILSENNRKAFEAIDRVTARLKARRDGTPLPREIEG